MAAHLLLIAVAAVVPALLRSDAVTYEWTAELGNEVLEQPIGLAYLSGRLYVSDAARNRIVVLDTAGTILDEWDGGEEGFARPMQLHADHEGRLYVAEYLADRVSVLATAGERAGTVVARVGGTTGSDPGALDAPGGAAPFGDRLFVADFYNHRIQVFELSGRYLGRSVGPLNLPTAAVRGGRGELYVADFGNGRIVRFEVVDPGSGSSEPTPSSLGSAQASSTGTASNPTRSMAEAICSTVSFAGS